MKLTFVLATLLCFSSFAQDPAVYNAIVEEGKMLYRNEVASWYGTDLFMEQLGHKRDQIGGYISYPDGEQTRCIFFNRAENISVIASFTFDADLSKKTAVTDTVLRKLNTSEETLYQMRQKALEIVPEDSLFLFYNNTNYNFIPLVHNGERKVYILTAPQVDGLIVLGNDYLLTYDEQNNLKEKRKIHSTILVFETGDKNNVGAMHSHLSSTGDYITATDICTLMLYARFAGWETHTVVGEKYISLWDCSTNSLTVVDAKSFGKTIEKEEKKRKKRKE